MRGRTLPHQLSAAFAGPGADVDDVVGAAYRVFVVFDHHQRVATFTELAECAQQNLVVARVQADGRFVQYITDTLQIGAKLRSQPDALRLTARQRGRTTVQRQVAQAHVFQEFKAAFDLGNQIPGDASLAAGQGQLFHPGAYIGHRQRGDIGNADPGKSHRPRLRVQARALATGAGRIQHVVGVGLGKTLFAALVVVVTHRVVKHLALLPGQLHTGTNAVGAPAVFAVVAEQARIKFGIGGGTHRAGALRR